MCKTYKNFLFAFFFMFIGPNSVASIELTDFESYLNSIHSLKSKFNQINADGSISNGVIWLKKPGKLRFEYQNPNSLLLVANSGFLAIIDKISNTPPQRYLLNSTPLSFLTEESIKLVNSEIQYFLNKDIDSASLTIPKINNKINGSLVINFKINPIEFDGWVLETPSGDVITMKLLDPEFNLPFKDESIFGIGAEIQKHMLTISN